MKEPWQGRAVDQRALRELATTGSLRVGIIRAPVAGVLFVSVDHGVGPIGVTVDLADAFASALDLHVNFEVFSNSGECTEALAAGDIDLSFMPVDEERRRKIDFGPAYYQLRSTLLATAEAGCLSLADYRARGRRFAGISGTTTLRAAIKHLDAERAIQARSVDDALDLLRDGTVDALALSDDYLRSLLPDLPGACIFREALQETSISVALGKGRPRALVLAGDFVNCSKENGLIRRIFDAHGQQAEAVASPE
jgi:polar amino acid transport system substrate-binding protein